MESTENKLNRLSDAEKYLRWFHRILSHWHLFLLSISLAYGGTWTYLKYTTTVYNIGASVLVKDASQNINPFDRTGEYIGYSRTYNLSNDIKVFTSRRLVEETVRKIDWQVTYFIVGSIKNTEVYKFDLFRIIPDDSSAVPFNFLINLKVLKNQTFELNFAEEKTAPFKFKNPYNFNEAYTINGFRFKIVLPNANLALNEGSIYAFKINSFDAVVNEYMSKLRVVHLDKTSSVLSFSSQGSNQDKEKDFINTHCQSSVRVSLIEKNLLNEKVINFVEQQMRVISDTLSDIEFEMIRYKKQFNSANIETVAERKFLQIDRLEEEKARLNLNRQYLSYLKEYLKNHSEYDDIIAPSSVGVSEPMLAMLVNQLVELKMKQNISFKVDNLNSPFRKENEARINKVLKNIFELLGNIDETTKKAIDDLQRKIDANANTTNSVLQNEKSFIELKRQYQIQVDLYNILLRRGAEMSIIKAGNLSDSRVIDVGGVNGIVYPIASKLYIQNLFIAFLLPLIFIVLKYLLNVKVMEKDDVTSLCDMPFLGTIGHIDDKDRLVVINKPKSVLAESFRALRANLTFFLPRPEQKVILITSSLSGEGKTFTSLNIASILAVTGKKVVLIGADMRKPKVYLEINVRNVDGLSNFLANKSTIDAIISKTNIENLSFINSGVIPPNPAELMMSYKADELFDYLRENYDYIIIDTPPLGLVSDSISLMKYSDINIYVVRHNYTQIKYIKQLKEMIQSGLVSNIKFLMNDYDVARNYGKGYSYGYYAQKYGSKIRHYDYYEESRAQKGFFGFFKDLFGKKN